MTPKARTLAALVKRETARMTPTMRRTYLRAVDALRNSLGVQALTDLVSSGQSLSTLITPAVLQRATMQLRAESKRVVERAFGVSVKNLPGAGKLGGQLAVEFNVLNPRVRAALDTLESKILKDFGDTARETLRQHVQAGLDAGAHPRTIARGVRDVVGLTPSQERAVRNFRNHLTKPKHRGAALDYTLRDKRFDRLIKNGKPLTAPQVDKMVQAYQRRYIAHHANVVAHNTTLNAYRAGQHSSFQEAIDVGLVDESRAYKEWVTVGDDQVRPEHVVMNRQRVPVRLQFSNGRQYPDEWGCRCIAMYGMELAPRATGLVPTPPPTKTAFPTLKERKAAAAARAAARGTPAPLPPLPRAYGGDIVARRRTPPPSVGVGTSERLLVPHTAEELAWVRGLDDDTLRNFDGVVGNLKAVRQGHKPISSPFAFSHDLPVEVRARALWIGEGVEELFGRAKRNTVRIEYTQEAGASYSTTLKRIKLGPGHYASDSTIAHEIVHSLEDTHRALLEWQHTMLNKYSDGRGPLQVLTEYNTPGQPPMTGYTGRFLTQYQGRIYGRPTDPFATEFLSVAVETLVSSPFTFMLKHPDMFADVMILLRRLNRHPIP